ncbi:MAG: hypothetical protein KF803_07995 [Cyclobacteriaceae bacterium]|nr:hypothetical protein [Cyclobacteriaceae bacterium]
MLNKFKSTIDEHRVNNFPEREGFVGGEIKHRQFIVFRTGKSLTKVFPVHATGKVDENGNWTLTFTSSKLNLIMFILTFGAMLFVNLKYEAIFFAPLMLYFYIAGQITFNRDAQILEKIIMNKLSE